MQQETLRATKRTTSGSRASRRLRDRGRVPAVVYGSGLDTTEAVHVDRRELYGVLHTDAGLNAIIEVDIEGAQVLTVAREIQRDPIRGTISHLDLIQVSLDVEIEAEVHIEYTGTPVGVVDDGGIAETLAASITISALPNAIPASIEVDVTHLGLHDTLTVADLPEVEGVTYLADEGHPLLTVVTPAAEIVEEPEVDELEGEEAIEGEEGDEAAADAVEEAEDEEG
ncbi:MAG: 50S ribosomal protein L25 [Acidimicrobiia bacterium]